MGSVLGYAVFGRVAFGVSQSSGKGCLLPGGGRTGATYYPARDAGDLKWNVSWMKLVRVTCAKGVLLVDFVFVVCTRSYLLWFR